MGRVTSATVDLRLANATDLGSGKEEGHFSKKTAESDAGEVCHLVGFTWTPMAILKCLKTGPKRQYHLLFGYAASPSV